MALKYSIDDQIRDSNFRLRFYNLLSAQIYYRYSMWHYINTAKPKRKPANNEKSVNIIACQVYDAECVSKIKTILSIIFIFTIWGCVSSAYPILLWWSRECVLYLIIIIKPEVWIINHCLGLGHETMVCVVCLTMFLWICDMTRLLRGTFHVLVVFAPNLVLCHLACSITILLGTLLMSDT